MTNAGKKPDQQTWKAGFGRWVFITRNGQERGEAPMQLMCRGFYLRFCVVCDVVSGDGWYLWGLTKTDGMDTKKLAILQQSLVKKQAALNDKFDTHFATVAQANGQPLNDKRNGQATLNKWEKQNDGIRTQIKSIEKTHQAIEREEGKISGVENAKKSLPEPILKMLASGQLIQWRMHPNTFFVKGVDRARIVWEPKKNLLMNRYRTEVKDQAQWTLFKNAYNTLLTELQNISVE